MCWWCARSSRPESVADVVKLAKAKPGTLTFGSMGNGSGAHLAGELFKTKAGIDMLHVPYKGFSAGQAFPPPSTPVGITL